MQTNIKPLKELCHNIQAGDILYNSWGWEQTNIDFYQVVSVTKKTIKIRRIASKKTIASKYGERGTTTPLKNQFVEQVITKTPFLLDDVWRVNFKYGSGRQWSGEPLYYSSYA